jgi:hypothetical protein
MKSAPAQRRVATRSNLDPPPRVFRWLTLSEAHALWKEKGGERNGSARAGETRAPPSGASGPAVRSTDCEGPWPALKTAVPMGMLTIR